MNELISIKPKLIIIIILTLRSDYAWLICPGLLRHSDSLHTLPCSSDPLTQKRIDELSKNNEALEHRNSDLEQQANYQEVYNWRKNLRIS
ncbi:hypothetical protein Pmani_020377 [Petrolisthes manimaculis]|uniref:Uncharacterized protein n=1 Tax=Petrolisthes manimaculis TaxID=1843537 RepID=A0AAE1PGD3_9EUCA|nr:hypothetical protein Pmani_020377 [Petrolisthes manimaculis]